MRQWIPVLLCAAGCAASVPAQTVTALPGNSGQRLQGDGIAVEIRAAHGHFQGLRVTDELARHKLDLPQAFVLTMKDGTVLRSSAMSIGPLAVSDLPTGASASHAPGKRACADFSDPEFPGTLRWCLTMREHAGYFRQELTLHATSDAPIAEVRMLDFNDPGAHVSGTVRGSPIVDAGMFFGFEHPLSTAHVDGGHVVAALARVLPLRAGQSTTYSSVVGVAAPGQMRRAFLRYIENERPRAYSPFLHYNSWFDIAYGGAYNETEAIDRIHAFGRELVDQRHVEMNSFLFDDGWDNPNSLWGFNSGFPDGFTKTAAAAKQIHAGIGVWFSPWGGYMERRKERIAYGRAHGYEIINGGYALSGPKYYHRFEQVCLEMIDRYGVNQFKIDGTGNANRVFPGSAFDSDFDAAIHLIQVIREHKPGIFINLTTGTYPSPFWLFTADSIWRGGDDDGFAGVGTSRQQWITYRDEQTYRNTVQRGPLFPINSLMLHGLIYAKLAARLSTDPGHDFPDEVHDYFATGTQLQEMYITPSLLSSADWDVLAHAAKWARRNADILEDTHWIGGDPGQLQVYGWAAWSPHGWIVTLRNPSDKPQTFTLDLESALQVPHGASFRAMASNPFGQPGAAPVRLDAHHAEIRLAPFEVRTFESTSGDSESR
ncbi:MAG: enterotoxin [Acidobacteriaceae bacterium]